MIKKKIDQRIIDEICEDFVQGRKAKVWKKNKPLTGEDAIIEKYLETEDIHKISELFEISVNELNNILKESGVI